ncbi:MAG: glycosyltransferase family 39 protein [Bacteroidetes bacterium]|nr:glycosyltransferase family 39 protein [Bacteroidota bacterium]MBS1631404.1 glycosyltransferase family 39 protein [Bacteroidota bacterium]
MKIFTLTIMNSGKSLRNLLWLLILIKIVLPFFLQNDFYQPHRDEYLYLAEAHHMAWGYMEIPPFLSVFAWISNLFGAGLFWIRIWPDLFGALTFLLVGKIIISLGGKKFALILGWLPFVLDGYMRLFFLFMPNFLDVFFWTLIAFTLIRFIETEQNKWLYGFGVAVGLGMMSKYSVAFYTISILGGLLLTQHRKIFLNKHFYYSCLIALFIFLPNIIWQYNHRFPVITHMNELQDEQLKYNSAIGFITSQLMMNFPCVFIWIAGLIYISFLRSGKKFRFLGWAYLFVIVLLIVLRGKDYYALGAYPVLFAFGAYQLEKASSVRLKWTRYAMLIFSIAFGLFAMPLVMPLAKPETLVKYYEKTHLNRTGSFKWEDQQMHPLPQDFADMMGWKEMAMKAGAIYNSLPANERAKTFVYCRGYFSAGALNYYRKEAGLPETYSDNASFLFWLPDKYDVKNLILVGHSIPDSNDIVFRQFATISIKDSINMPLFRENGMKIILCQNGSDSLNYILTKTVAKLKNEFMR